ncbi:MAG: hypothetical protein DWQ20_05790 [Actinobacteria bacterium]|nr:MAG: hypothetical protein DWQ20_05790 [Actinomycetota bacterium]
MKLLSSILIGILIVGCAGFDTTSSTVESPTSRAAALSEPAESVRNTLALLSKKISAQSIDGDVGLAWSDLESDVRSVVDDLMRDPDSVDAEGMKDRVASFAKMVAESKDATLPTDVWDEFVAAFSHFIDEASGSA